MTRRITMGLLGLAATATLLVGPVGAAFAHVTITPDVAFGGSYATLTFKVPNERDTASTTALEVDFPTDTPLRGVSVLAHPGWSYDVTRIAPSGADTATGPTSAPSPSPSGHPTSGDMSGMNMNMPGMDMSGRGGMSRPPQLSSPAPSPAAEHTGSLAADTVSRITWTAQGPGIRPGQFDQFTISVGPLPSAATSLTFKALQTYSSGEVVRWIEQAAPGAPEPAHPAPTIRLVPRPAGASGTVADYAVGMVGMGGGDDTGSGSAQSMPGMKMGGSADQPMGGMSMGGMSMGGMSMGSSSSDTSDAALAVGIGGLFAGLLGLSIGAAGLRRGRAAATAGGRSGSVH